MVIVIVPLRYLCLEVQSQETAVGYLPLSLKYLRQSREVDMMDKALHLLLESS